MNILALDVGTTSMRGILFDSDGRQLAQACVTTPLEQTECGYIEQFPSRLEQAAINICREISAQYQVDAVSLTAYRSAVCLVDRSGEPLCNFIMWQDTRNNQLCSRFVEDSELLFQKSGARINTVFTATRLLWLKENRNDLYKRAYKAVIVPDFLIKRMTGEFVTDKTYGSRTHLMNIRTLEWDRELCALFGIDPDKLCRLIDQGTQAGRITRSFSMASGLPEGIPVISAGGDQQCAALGLGVLDTDSLEINCGTGSFIIGLADRLELEGSTAIWNVSALRGRYIVESNILSSASALNWTLREFYPELWGECPDFAAADRIVQEVPPGANGVVCLAHFQGCGTRDWNAASKAAFWGLSLCSSKADILRALYEGICAEIAKSIDALPFSCRRAQQVQVAGGLSRSGIFNQILCDMLERRVVRYKDPQATAIGAFVSASTACGLYSDARNALHAARREDPLRICNPDPAIGEVYREVKGRSERIYRLARDINGKGNLL